jgi:hypothetical protein
MLEKKSQSINELFWNKQVIPRPPQAPSGNGNEEDKGGESDTDELQETEPLAVILVNSMFHLLFLPGHLSPLFPISDLASALSYLLPIIQTSRSKTLIKISMRMILRLKSLSLL